MRLIVRLQFALIGLVSLAGVSALANGPVVMVYPNPPVVPALELDKPVWRFSQAMDGHTRSNVTNSGGGKLYNIGAISKAEYFLRTREQLISADFTYRWNSYTWNSSSSLITDTGSYRFNILGFQKLGNDEWSFVGLANATLQAEYNGGDIPSSGSYLFGAGLQYDVTPSLKVGLGVTVNDTPINLIRVWPMILLQWKISQQLTLRSSDGLQLIYDPNNDTRLDIGVRYTSGYIGLHVQETTPGTYARPVAQETSVDIVFGAERQLNNWLRLRATVDGRLYNEFQFYQDKHSYKTLRQRPDIGFSLSASVAF